MQRRSNINLNSIGLVSCMLLLLMTFLAISPTAAVATYAEEVGGEEPTVDEAVIQDDEAEISPAVESGSKVVSNSSYKTSSITIGFTPVAADTILTPVVGSGSKGRVDVRLDINIKNSDGYQIYVGSNSSQLKNGDEYVDAVAGPVSYSSLPTNHWGYALIDGDNASTESTQYEAMPATVRGTAKRASGAGNKNIVDKDLTYTLSFAANIGPDKPSGTYSNEVTVSVVSSPREVSADFGIGTMQEMTSAVCASAKDNDGDGETAGQLEDVRDGKYYWVGKMPDGRCWMTQNLDLDLFDDVELKGDTTNLSGGASATWAPSSSTIMTATIAPDDDSGQYSWSMSGQLGDVDYYTANPDSTASCGSKVENITKCGANDVGKWTLTSAPKSANGDTNAHRLLGNFYSWGAATAGATTTSVSTAGQNAPQSICPLGWRLPTSGEGGEFQKLANALGVTTGTATTGTVSKLTDAPFYAVRGGAIGNADYLFVSAGTNGVYWSSTASSDTNAYNLSFYHTANVYPSNDLDRRWGYSVRCINDPTK